MKPLLLTIGVSLLACTVLPGQEAAVYQVGFAKVDITPEYPVRLNGFGVRREESEGVSQSIFARAMAVSQGDAAPLVVVAIDNLGIRTAQVDEVARRLNRSHHLPRKNFCLTFTHSHCAPKVSGASDNIFSEAIPAEHQKHIDQYTTEIVDAITTSAQQAVDSRQPSTLGWSIGTVGFAKNRRPGGGPVDHDLPTLIVRDANSKMVRGVYVSYACHCVTLRFNKISGDWAGYAAEMIERQFPDAVALVSIGAGSDQNPMEITPDNVQIALRQGTEIASEVKRLSEGHQRSVQGKTRAILNRIELPLNELPTRQQLSDIAVSGPRPTDRYNAMTQIEKLDRGEQLLAAIDYPIQTWAFGDSLCLTFLAGEVCVDYAVRLKKEFDAERFWLITYSNDFCSYIPSERLVKEKGYGGGAEVPYFALPTTLAPGLEQRIVDEVHRQVSPTFAVPLGVQGVAPKSAEDSLLCMKTDDQLRISIVACEPLVRDPVAIDFGVDGCVWVAEMPDYGRGVYEAFEQTGRVRCLRDQDGDGKLDNATTFVAGLRFPTDVKVWRDGLLICDAPEILYARDTNGDGSADEIETLFSGFEVRNAQARVNSLRWGLDNWIHGSCGLFGGQIKSHKTGMTTNLGGRDFRMDPDSGEIEAVTGRTQQGRCRNDWGDWFGCSNGSLLRHYSDNDRYVRRNQFATASSPVGLTGDSDAHRLYPPGNLVRFALSGAPGTATSACGLGIYRDITLGDEYFGSALTCEPVQQLVHRIKLSQDELGYKVERGEGETQSEFLTSTDRWFRPVQSRTGPNGGLWVVDMYRYVVEHPRWIPQSTLSELDVFAGQQLGRIYRVTPSNSVPQSSPLPDLTTKSNIELARLLGATNGTLRDLAHQLLVWRQAGDVVAELCNIVKEATLAQSKIHALAVLDALGALDNEAILGALRDEHSEVVRHAVRLSEPMLGESAEVREAVLSLASHDSPRVRRQVAWSLGQTDHPEAVPVLAALASRTEPVAHVRSAVLSSIRIENAGSLLRQYLQLANSRQVPAMLQQIVKSAIRLGEVNEIEAAIRLVTRESASFTLLAEALDAADARIGDSPIEFAADLRSRVVLSHHAALNNLSSGSSGSLGLLGRYRGSATRSLLLPDPESPTSIEIVSDAIVGLLTARQPVDRQLAAVKALARTRHVNVASVLLSRYAAVNLKTQSAILDSLLSRREWTLQLLDRIQDGHIRPSVLGVDRRAKLLSNTDVTIRNRATQVLGMQGSPSRIAIVEKYRRAHELTGVVDRGRTHFRKHCSACHQLEGHGHVVGPDLLGLTNRDPQWLLTAILDPNREVDARYVSWSALTEDGRLVSGLVIEETASIIRLRESGGKEHQLPRAEIAQFRASHLSLMPEGLEKELMPQDVSDLLAYVSQAIGPVQNPAATATLPRYPSQIAPFLLDESQSTEVRQQVIDQRPGMGPAIVGLLVQDLHAVDTDTLDQRLPWIWRVALAVGRRNDGGEIRDLLEQSLPKAGSPLADWQAVVVGGGIINGLGHVGSWPGRRVGSILNGAPSLRPRWQQTLNLAAAMADDSNVSAATRYDALRIVALSDPSTAIPHLEKYLKHDSLRQLQMGAVSGLADIETPAASGLLIQSLSFLKNKNRQLAIEALLRTQARCDALKRATRKHQKLVNTDELESLRDHRDEEIARNAVRLIQTLNISNAN
ncbi:MAG: neutral/alkaline non-lysosomal ceramidase N-terminal domain-containing protein [Rubripirellula sp.]|nr:neutral/alkaline non-lysosomal ceramidase N-terminal domain-containing protein [Rubripirellula sp.]